VPDAIRLSELDVLFVRTLRFPNLAAAAGRGLPTERSLPAREALALQHNLLRMLAARIPVINTLEAALSHRLKPYQCFVLKTHGIQVPETLTTDDPEKMADFLKRCPRHAVVKPLAGGAEVVMAGRELLNRARLRQRPLVLQQYVAGRSLRAYCLGGEIISMGEIAHDRDVVDWREREKAVQPCEPTEELQREIGSAARALDLAFCSVDLVYDSEMEQYFLLDLSPSPLFAGWSKATGTDLAHVIAEYLVGIANGEREVWGGG
jgi:glutathione synthase/RimK-type ligase-like ATP-grasp enzyme